MPHCFGFLSLIHHLPAAETVKLQDVVLDMSNASVRGGRTRFLKEGDAFGIISFFTGAEQMEAS